MIFISHEETDTALANALVEFLRASLNIPAESIRCTSVPGFQLPFGKTISEQLKSDIGASNAVLVLVTRASLGSRWVVFELGAAWALGSVIVPILSPGLSQVDLPGPLAEYPVVSSDDPNAAARLRDAVAQVAQKLSMVEKGGGEPQSRLESFVTLLREWSPMHPPKAGQASGPTGPGAAHNASQDSPPQAAGNSTAAPAIDSGKLFDAAGKSSRRKRTERQAAFGFGVVFVITLLALAIAVPNPTPFQYNVFRIVLALAAAGVAATIPGFIQVTVHIWLRAGGALAVFAIVFFYNPASLVVPTRGISSGHTGGSSSGQPHPLLTLIPEVADEAGSPISRREAPFKIRVKGTATGVDRSYVYLVVDDSNAQWIMPTGGLGPNVGKEFSGYCYLGVENARDSLRKLYRVFAVATNREYTEYEKLDRRTLLAESSVIEILRVK